MQGTEGVRTVLRYAARTVLPFFAVSIVYVVVLKLATYQAFPDKGLPFNLRNIFLAFCTLFIPEERLNNWSINLVAPAVFLAVSALGVAASGLDSPSAYAELGTASFSWRSCRYSSPPTSSWPPPIRIPICL